MLYYFDSACTDTPLDLCAQLLALMQSEPLDGRPIVLLCIGSDRSTGDSLGPLIGYKLHKYYFENVYIYGSLYAPVHATNLAENLNTIRCTYKNPYIIAVDAALGKQEHIGYITLGTGPLKPGLGVKKKLPEVGDLHITGIVNTSGDMDNLSLQTTRLSTIMTLADIITNVFVNALCDNTHHQNHLFQSGEYYFMAQNNYPVNVYPYTQQSPGKLYLQRLTS